MHDRFDVVIDGNSIKNSKPNPEVFLLAANNFGIPTQNYTVIEDAYAGIDVAVAASAKPVGVGYAANY